MSPIAVPVAPVRTEPKQPWVPWELGSALEGRPPSMPPETRLAAVTDTSKRTVDDLGAVPDDLLTTCPVETRTIAPRTLGPGLERRTWYPQLKTAFLLHLHDGFIGDNVVFDHERYYRLGRWWLGDSWEIYRSVKEVRHIEAGVSVGGWGGEAFQHFMLGALPKLAMVIDLLERPEFDQVQIVSHDDGSPAAQWFWRKLELVDRVVQKPKDARAEFVIHADLVLFAQYDPNPFDYGLWARNTLGPLQRRLGLLEPAVQDLVVYLERPGPGLIRSVANDAEVIAGLERLLAGTGYRLHRFTSGGDQQEDMEILARAKVVVGPHGGSFANLVFVQPGTHVIEFLPIYRLLAQGADPRPHYWGLAQAAGLDYWTVDPKDFDFNRPGMRVDPGEVAAIVAKVLS